MIVGHRKCMNCVSMVFGNALLVGPACLLMGFLFGFAVAVIVAATQYQSMEQATAKTQRLCQEMRNDVSLMVKDF